MRTLVLLAVLPIALAARPATAQIYSRETPRPVVTAADAQWQVNGEPVMHAGNVYYPAGATVFFDGKVMVQTGSYGGVPLYADVTLEPFSIVYVPVGGALMQPYERRREGDIAGTVGSRTPSFPVGRDAESSASPGRALPEMAGLAADDGVRRRSDVARSVRASVTLDAARPEEFAPVGAMMISPAARPRNTSSRTFENTSGAANAGGDAGLWIAFDGARWFSAGRAVDFDGVRFVQAGTYQGFPVFRERGATNDRIFVTIVRNGPLAPFERR